MRERGLPTPAAEPCARAQLVRAAGGVCIADEVQTGFGRTGSHFWGFQTHGVQPDIVTMAKVGHAPHTRTRAQMRRRAAPRSSVSMRVQHAGQRPCSACDSPAALQGIGNGLPLAAVITTPEIARTLAAKLHFNTFGGNPVCCAGGRAVLQALDEDRCQENSAEVRLSRRWRALRGPAQAPDAAHAPACLQRSPSGSRGRCQSSVRLGGGAGCHAPHQSCLASEAKLCAQQRMTDAHCCARQVGSYLLDGFRRLQDKHDVIGDVRGKGLMTGVELVSDRQSKAPATAETAQARRAHPAGAMPAVELSARALHVGSRRALMRAAPSDL